MTAPFIELCSGESLAFGELARRASPPDPFAPGAPFWRDPYISERLLEAHLAPDVDAASRRHDRIDEEVEWLVSALSLEEGDSVLDLGCGPGLYCERLADFGLDVTGIDLSPTALEYANTRAVDTGREITYSLDDYRELSLEESFDAAILVYFDFGTFANEDRDRILESVHDVLGPGGRFAFDVHTEAYWTDADVGTAWKLEDGAGFWRPTPHLVLSETISYPDHDTFLDQHLVVDESGRIDAYRFWERYYEPADLEAIVAEYGLTVEGVWTGFRGEPFSEEAASVSVVSRRSSDRSAAVS